MLAIQQGVESKFADAQRTCSTTVNAKWLRQPTMCKAQHLALASHASERTQAQASKYQRKLCKAVHSGLRYPANGACIECILAGDKGRYSNAKAAQDIAAYRARRTAMALKLVTIDSP